MFTNAGSGLAHQFLPEQTALMFTNAGSGLALIWPASASYFALQVATNLTPPVAWVRATNAPVLTNGHWTVPIAPATNGNRFFRLQAE